VPVKPNVPVMPNVVPVKPNVVPVVPNVVPVVPNVPALFDCSKYDDDDDYCQGGVEACSKMEEDDRVACGAALGACMPFLQRASEFSKTDAVRLGPDWRVRTFNALALADPTSCIKAIQAVSPAALAPHVNTVLEMFTGGQGNPWTDTDIAYFLQGLTPESIHAFREIVKDAPGIAQLTFNTATAWPNGMIRSIRP
jgi:hypothetical protein